MNLLRKIISALVLVVSITLLVGICLNSNMEIVWQAFGNAFNPFDFQKVISACMLFLQATSTPIILMMLSLIGLTIPKVKK